MQQSGVKRNQSTKVEMETAKYIIPFHPYIYNRKDEES